MATATRRSSIRGEMNHRKALRFQLRGPVEGPQGTGKALAQSIENSADAYANEIVIYRGEFEGRSAIFIEDDGRGMEKADLKSMVGFGYTAKKGKEAEHMAGVVGTGSKLWIGLGREIEDVKLTYFTSSEGVGLHRIDIDFDYLVALAEKGGKGVESPIVVIDELPDNWSRHFSSGRKTGTTLVVTGFDEKEVWKTHEIISRLCYSLVPKIARRVKVPNFDGAYSALELPDFSGEPFEFSYEADTLGRVDLTLFVGNSGEQLKICAPHALLHSYPDSLKYYSPALRKEHPNIFRRVAGYIVIEHARKWKQHDGSFDRDFYRGKASDELLEILKLIQEDVEAKVEEVEEDERVQRQRSNLRKLGLTNQELFDTPLSVDDGGDEEAGGTVEKGGGEGIARSLGPSLKRIPVESERVIKLHDPDGQIRYPERTKWIIRDERLVKILGSSKGSEIAIKSGSLTGKTMITLLNKDFGPTGEMVSPLSVYKPIDTIRIVGPSTVLPGTETLYRLVDYGEGIDPERISWSKKWQCKQRRKGGTYPVRLNGVRLSDKDADTVVLQCEPKCDNGIVYVRAKPHRQSSVELRKKVRIVEPDPDEGNLIWKIGHKLYRVVESLTFQSMAVVVDPEEEIPTIDVNPRANIIEYIRSEEQTWIMAISFAAHMSQRESGIYTSHSHAVSAHEEFVDSMLGKHFSLK